MSNDSLVEVAGAGPAGLTAAITAARAGARVVVYERAAHVGSRFHGDFQGLENWTTNGDVLDEIATLGVAPSFPAAPFHEQVCIGPDGGEYMVRAQTPAPFYYLVRRGPGEGTLDRALRAQAEAAGVEIRFGQEVAALPRGGILSHGPRRGDAVAVGYVFDTDMADGSWAALGLDVAPGGYAYLLVQGGFGTLSVCLFSRFRELKAFLERARQLFVRHAGLRMKNPRPFGGAGTLAIPRTAARDGVLLAGEAAGFQDPLWGFGIRHAMRSGHLAARALVGGVPETYEEAWRQRIATAMRAAAVMRWFYSRLGNRGYRRLCQWLSEVEDPRAALRWLYAPAWWKQALYPVLGRPLLGRPLLSGGAPELVAPSRASSP
ncbi:MAG TPA: NAD(P)/FAD-dependent oxidoreductase [Thermoanaerobaculia bacterium]|jgi:flavin-dependent dehydrogenase|nr:NAD(P)/FAD-dependent oxidoreductase [Thermoanaerobaculia bacterium]